MRGVSTAFEILMLLSILSSLTLIVLLNFQNMVSSSISVRSVDEANFVAYKIALEINSISSLQNAKKRLEIPEKIGGKFYLIELRDGCIRIKNDRVDFRLNVSANLSESIAYSSKAYIVVEDGYVRVENG